MFLITVLIFLIMGISAVSAEDINQTDNSLEISDSEVISADEPAGSFADLSKAILGSNTELDIKTDYKFNSATDENLTRGIAINFNDESFTINGNGHVIDADNKASVFKFSNGKLYLNNLKIVNASMSSIILNNCILYTNNVTFENNHDNDEGAAIYAQQSNYYSNHDKFINNYAKNGASIYGVTSIISINNSTFINDNAIHWSLIYGYNSIMTVNNTVFANITSRYATAIYSEGNKLTVLNSKFINLYANATAGAIGVKQNLKLAKVKVKKSAKKLVIKATLKGKKPIKGKKLTFKFNGKTYKAKTDKKGIAKITIKKSVLKKLKVGKKVKYQVTYLKNTVKQSVKVKK